MRAQHCGLWATLVLLTTLLASPAGAQTPIVVHHIGPLTGVLAESNKEALDGARLYLEAFNARGGVQGRPVRLQILDDGQDPKRTKAVFDELAAGDKLLALMMPRTTPSIEILLPGLAKHGVPVIGPHSGASFVNHPPKREIFALRASYQKEAEVAIRQQHSVGNRRFGLLLADDAFGRDTLIGIERTMTELGLVALASAKVDNRKPDVTQPIKAMLEHRPQVVLLIVSSKAAADFVKGYRAGGGRATFVSLSNTSNNAYVHELGDQARGAIVMQVMPSPFSAVTLLAREYASAARKAKLESSYAGLFGFASAKLLTLGLLKAGREPSREGLLKGLEALGEVDLGGLRLRYGPDEREGSTYVDPTIITVGGRFLR